MINICEENSTTIVEIKEVNRLTVVNAGELKTTLNNILSKKGQIAILDLAEVKYMDSTGISVLISALKTSKECGSSFSIKSIQPEVIKVLALMKIDKIFDIVA